MKFSKLTQQLCITALSSGLIAVAPSADAATPSKKIDVSKIKTNIDDVVVPVPSEVFNVLDKLGHPAWESEVQIDTSTKPSSRPHISLLFGTVIADGFLAVEAKDKEKVKEIGRRVLELANALAVRHVVESHCQSIIDAADANNWNVVRSELDKTQADVKQAMEELKSRDESQLVSIGGWLRGTEALSDIVLKDYQPDRAELLHQPDLLATFDRQLNAMSPKTRTSNLITKLQSGLSQIQPLIATDEDTLKKDNVEQINHITTSLVKAIRSNNGGDENASKPPADTQQSGDSSEDSESANANSDSEIESD